MIRRPMPSSGGIASTADGLSDATVTDPTVARFSVVDDMFYRGHHGRGPSSVMQGVWRFPDRITPDDLAAMHAALCAGALTRRVHSPRVPFARRALVGGARVTPLVVDEIPIRPGEVVAWADTRARTPLDVDRGPVWELALGHVADAGSVVTLTCSHLVTGGVGMVAIAEASLATGDAAPDPPPPPAPPRLRDDLRDALVLWIRVIVGVARSVARACTDPIVRSEHHELDSTTNRRGVHHAVVRGPAGRMDVYCTHLTAVFTLLPYPKESGTWASEQRAQVDALQALIADTAETDQIVVLGDFNTGPAAEGITAEQPDSWSALSEGWSVPYVEAGGACTWCPDNPLIGGGDAHILDHVLVRGFDGGATTARLLDEATSIDVCDEAADGALSDHYAVAATLTP